MSELYRHGIQEHIARHIYSCIYLCGNLASETEIIILGNDYICAEQPVSLRVGKFWPSVFRRIERDSDLRAKRSRLTLVLPLRMWTR